MAQYSLTASTLDVSQEAILVDTSVLVGAFLPGDQFAETAKCFLDSAECQLIVPVEVVVEAWGLIVGRGKRFDRGVDLLTWLSYPGNADLIAGSTSHFPRWNDLTRNKQIDVVDAVLLCLADEMSKACRLRPPAKIATFDTRDFLRFVAGRLRFRLYDLRSDDIY